MKIKQHVEVDSAGVIARLHTTQKEDVELRYSGNTRLAGRVSREQLFALARRDMVRGWVYTVEQNLCYAILMVPLEHAKRVMRLSPVIPAGGPHASHRRQAPGAKRWVPRPDRAKTGHHAHERKVSVPDYPTVMEAVPGSDVEVKRHVVGKTRVQPFRAIICGEEML